MKKAQSGFSLVEVLLAVSVFGLIVTGLIGGLIYGQQSTALAGERARANLLADEGLEAVRNIRDENFSNLTDGTYGLAVSDNKWTLSGTSDTTDIFTRSLTISSVDANRKQVAATVSWQQNPQRAGVVSLVSRLTYWMKSISIGNWASPIEAANIDLSGTQSGLKIQVQGNYAYITRYGDVPNFLVIDISNSVSPVLVGSLDLIGTPQNIFVSDNYAYVVSEDNGQELQIINIVTPSSPAVIGTYDAPGNANGLGVFVSGTTAYLVRASSADDEFIVVNVATPSNPSFVGSLDLGETGNDVVVSGSKAYIASASNSQELQVIDIANPATPSVAGSYNISGYTDADSIALVGTTVFLSQGSLIYTIGISNPTTPSQLGSVDVGGKVNDIALNLGNSNTYLYITTRNTSAEFQVIDVTSLSSPTLLGSLDIAGTNLLNGIAYNATFDRAFAVGDPTNKEFIVIAPQ